MADLLAGFTDVSIGHWTDLDAGTGCTVVLCPHGAVAGVDVRGTAPATRETDLLNPIALVEEVNAICLSGGSAFGLAAADGVMQWLAERGYGFQTPAACVPIVPAACIYDLGIGSAAVRPDAGAGYAAANAAVAVYDGAQQGSVGAGTGAIIGKGLGMGAATKGGIGVARRELGLLAVTALMVVNPVGEVIDPLTGQILAGARSAQGEFVPTLSLFAERADLSASAGRTNTTIGVVLTNARLTPAGATKAAQMAHDGLARTIRPAHTHLDGDAIFVLSAGDVHADLSAVGALAAEATADAIVSAVRLATALHGIPASADLL